MNVHKLVQIDEHWLKKVPAHLYDYVTVSFVRGVLVATTTMLISPLYNQLTLLTLSGPTRVVLLRRYYSETVNLQYNTDGKLTVEY